MTYIERYLCLMRARAQAFIDMGLEICLTWTGAAASANMYAGFTVRPRCLICNSGYFVLVSHKSISRRLQFRPRQRGKRRILKNLLRMEASVFSSIRLISENHPLCSHADMAHLRYEQMKQDPAFEAAMQLALLTQPPLV